MLKNEYIFDGHVLSRGAPIRFYKGNEKVDYLVLKMDFKLIELICIEKSGEPTIHTYTPQDILENQITVKYLGDETNKKRISEIEEQYDIFPLTSRWVFETNEFKVGDVVRLYLINFSRREGIIREINPSYIEVLTVERNGEERIITVRAQQVALGKFDIEILSER